ATELPDRRARLVDLVPAARPQDVGPARRDSDRAHDPGPRLVAARTTRARVAAEEDVLAADVRPVVQRRRVPDGVEAVHREPGERAAEAVEGVDAMIEAAEHDVGKSVTVHVADGRRSLHAVLARDRHGPQAEANRTV